MNFENLWRFEGSAVVEKNSDIFFSSFQSINRDLSCLVLNTFAETEDIDLVVADAYAASGLRSLRYATEVPRCRSLLVNDINPACKLSFLRNISATFPSGLGAQSFQSFTMDACEFLLQQKGTINIVDVDPTGSPFAALFPAVSSIANGGLVCVNAFDMDVLSGLNDFTFATYGSCVSSTPFRLEVAIRVLLSAMAQAAGRCNRVIRPLLSCSIGGGYHIRVAAQVLDAADTKEPQVSPLSFVYYCGDCHGFSLEGLGQCLVCGCSIMILGPLWTQSTNNAKFLQLLKSNLLTRPRSSFSGELVRTVSLMAQESDNLFYFDIVVLSRILFDKRSPPISAIMSALAMLNFSCSRTHACSTAIKTNAPSAVVWDAVITWFRVQQFELSDCFSDLGRSIYARTSISPYSSELSQHFLTFVSVTKTFSANIPLDLLEVGKHSMCSSPLCAKCRPVPSVSNIPLVPECVEYHVGPDEEYATVQDAMSSAAAGGHIVVHGVEDHHPISVNIPLVFRGVGMVSFCGFVQCTGVNVSFYHVTFAGGVQVDSGMMRCVDCTFHGGQNFAATVRNHGSLELVGCHISNCAGGIQAVSRSHVLLSSCTIEYVTACAIDVRNGSTASMIDSVLQHVGKSGIFAQSNALLTLIHCVFQRCHFSAIEIHATASATLLCCDIIANYGGLFSLGGSVDCERCLFQSNKRAGIAVRCAGQVQVRESSMIRNGGAGVFAEDGATARVHDCCLADNQGGSYELKDAQIDVSCTKRI